MRKQNKKANDKRHARQKKTGGKKLAPVKNVPKMTYQEAADKISVKAWISRLGEECSELAAAISKYKRIVDNEFPCKTSAGDAFVDVINEAVDVQLAMDQCMRVAFLCGNINVALHMKAMHDKKAKIIRQVEYAICESDISDQPNFHAYFQNPNAVYGMTGTASDNPMRDALVEDLYDEFD